MASWGRAPRLRDRLVPEWLLRAAPQERWLGSHCATATWKTEEERVGTARLARMGSIFLLLLAVVACSSATTPSPTIVKSSPGTTPSPASTPGPTHSPTATPTASPTPSPRPMAPATVNRGPAMNQARESQAAVRLTDGRVLIIGGTVPFVGKCPMACIEPSTASVEVYDPKTGKFRRNGSLAEVRSNANAVLLRDGTVLVMGGSYGAPETMEIYDPASGKSALVKLPANLESLPAEAAISLLADGRVLIAGGTYDLWTSTSNVTLIFDPTNRKFSDGPLMAKPRQEATATLLEDGRVLIVGGEDIRGGYGSANGDAELLDPAKPLAKSTLLKSIYPLVSVKPETPTTLSDGRVLVATEGPYAGCMAPANPEVFDPRTDEFGYPGPMITPRSGASAVRVGDGRVIFFGGVDGDCSPVGTVEAFDPDSGTFQVIATGFPKITLFSSTLLDDGAILIAGGTSGAWDSMTAATWLLKP
jgi:hypothetical protein